MPWVHTWPEASTRLSRADRSTTRSRKAGNCLHDDCGCPNPIFLWEAVYLSTNYAAQVLLQLKDGQCIRAEVTGWDFWETSLRGADSPGMSHSPLLFLHV